MLKITIEHINDKTNARYDGRIIEIYHPSKELTEMIEKEFQEQKDYVTQKRIEKLKEEIMYLEVDLGRKIKPFETKCDP